MPAHILTFMPAKDIEESSRFYTDMGFTVEPDGDVRQVRLGDHGFLLQDFYVKDWGDNFMMAMHVDDAQVWVDRHAAIADRYPGTWNREPRLEDFGLVVAHFTDPTGVLWHITQAPTDGAEDAGS